MAKRRLSKSGNVIPPVASRENERRNAEKFIKKYGKDPKKAAQIKAAQARLESIKKGETLEQFKASKASQPATPAEPAAPDTVQTTGGVEGKDLGINEKTGAIDADKAVETVSSAGLDDTESNFNMNNPGVQTDSFGNTQTVTRDPVTGQVKIQQTGGAGLTAANDAFVNAATGFANAGNAAQAAADANYAYFTKDNAQNKAREMEAAKQELANRGIPIDASPDSLWSKSLQQIDSKYQALDDQARNQAVMTRDQSYATQANVLGQLGQTAQGQAGNFTPYQGGNQNQANILAQLLGQISGNNMNVDQFNKTLKLNEQQLQAKKRGGGGQPDNGPVFNGTAPGFNV